MPRSTQEQEADPVLPQHTAPRSSVPKASSPSRQLWLTWGKSSELAVRNLWTEPAEHSLVKRSAQWHFSFSLKNLGTQQPICSEMMSPCDSRQSPLGLAEKQKKKESESR